MRKILVTMTVLAMLVAMTFALPELSFAQGRGRGGRGFRAQAGQRAGYRNARARAGDFAERPCGQKLGLARGCLLYTSPSPRDATLSRMPSSA